jgi:hypothetical protein
VEPGLPGKCISKESFEFDFSSRIFGINAGFFWSNSTQITFCTSGIDTPPHEQIESKN